MKKERTPRQPKVWEALLALIVVIAVVVAAIRTKVGIQMGLAMGGCTAIVFALLMAISGLTFRILSSVWWVIPPPRC